MMKSRFLALGLGFALCSVGCATSTAEPAQSELLGRADYDTDCTPDMISFHERAHRHGRITAVSNAFVECMETAVESSLSLAGTTVGPYRKCTGDPLFYSSLQEQTEGALMIARSPNDLFIHCTGARRGSNASAPVNDGFGHHNDETFQWGEWLGDRAASTCWRDDDVDCPDAPKPWPFSQAAGIIWHEVFHNHSYHHGVGSSSSYPWQCGYQPADNWNYREHSMPYLVQGCMEAVLNASGEQCDIYACGAYELHLIDDLSQNSCSCVRDPELTGYPLPAPLLPDLQVQSISSRLLGDQLHTEVTIRNDGDVGAIDFNLVAHLYRDDGVNIALGSEDALVLQANDSAQLTFVIPRSLVETGVVYAVVDANDNVNESFESNNSRFQPIELPNLRSSVLRAWHEYGGVGGEVSVFNDGDAGATDFDLWVGVEDVGGALLSEEVIHVHSVPNGHEVVVPFELSFLNYAEQGRVNVRIDEGQTLPEYDESDNIVQGPIIEADMVAEYVEELPPEPLGAPHSLRPVYTLANRSELSVTNALFSRLDIYDMNEQRVGWHSFHSNKLWPGFTLTGFASFAISDYGGEQECNGHPFDVYRVRLHADSSDIMSETDETNNVLESRFVATDDQAPTISLTGGTRSFVVSSPSDSVSFTVSAAASDPDGDPLDFDWTSNASIFGGAITPHPINDWQAIVTVSADRLRSGLCTLDGSTRSFEVEVEVEVDDCILQASAAATFRVELELDIQDPEEANEAAHICELRRFDFRELETQMERFELIDELCLYVTPNPDGTGPCQALNALQTLVDRWTVSPGLPRAPVELVLVERLRNAVDQLSEEVMSEMERELAVSELQRWEEGDSSIAGVTASVLLQRALIDEAGSSLPALRLIQGEDVQGEPVLGWSLATSGEAKGAAITGLTPAIAPGAKLPLGYELVPGSVPVRVTRSGSFGDDLAVLFDSNAGDLEGVRLYGQTSSGEWSDLTVAASQQLVKGQLQSSVHTLYALRPAG